MLNACALNSRPLDSRIANRLPRPKSKLTNPGPRTAPFDSFPKVPGVGYTKALVLNHCVRVFGPLALAIWLARSGPQQGTPSLGGRPDAERDACPVEDAREHVTA